MNLIRLFLGLSGAGLVAAGLSSCLREPSYSSTPEIGFDNTQLIHVVKGSTRDSLVLTITYQDGDGDLGLTSDEVSNQKGPYYNTRYANNFFVVPFVKDGSGNFVSLASTGRFPSITESSYYSRFGHIIASADSKSRPIKGTLAWSSAFYAYSPFYPGEEVRFQVSIADRALHESNTIMTPSVFFPK